MGVTTNYRRNILRVRGVSDDLIDFWLDGVPRYSEFNQGDWGTFAAAHTHPRRWYKQFVNKSGGLIINRWSIDSSRLPSYIRFDTPQLIPHCTYFEHPDHPGQDCRYRTPPVFNKKGKPNGTKYVYALKDNYVGNATKQIDVHPLVRERLLASEDIPEIYLCLEGVINADALAARGLMVFSVPSVTMWRLADEDLTPWLEIFRRAPRVYIIPDSDYLKLPSHQGKPQFVNRQVRNQGDNAYIWLRDRGVQVWFLVPSYLSRPQARRYNLDRDERMKIGIGDHLAFDGNLEQWRKDTNPRGVHLWNRMALPRIYLPPDPSNRKDRHNRKLDDRFIQHLVENYGESRFYSPGKVAKALGWSEDKVLDSKNRCKERGVLTVWDGHAHVSDMHYYNDQHLFRYEITPGRSKQDAA